MEAAGGGNAGGNDTEPLGGGGIASRRHLIAYLRGATHGPGPSARLGGNASGTSCGGPRRGGLYSAAAGRSPAVSDANAGDLGGGGPATCRVVDSMHGAATELGQRSRDSTVRAAGEVGTAGIGNARKRGAVLLSAPAVAEIVGGDIAVADAAEPPAARRRMRGKQRPNGRWDISDTVMRTSMAVAVDCRPPGARRDGEPPT